MPSRRKAKRAPARAKAVSDDPPFIPTGSDLETPEVLPPSVWRNRIVGYGEAAPDQLLAHDRNVRVHPKFQQDALSGILREVGIVQNVIISQRSQKCLDGHLRIAMAISEGQATVPITYVDLTEQEELLVLASLDGISSLAGTDKDLLKGLLGDITVNDAGLKAFLDGLASQIDPDAEQSGIFGNGEPRATLAERFGVPPFSVLDARQGYWQDRKRTWLALGIQSELGRGGNLQQLSEQNDEYRYNKKEYFARRKANASPGGALMPAADYSKRKRGDGRGRAIG